MPGDQARRDIRRGVLRTSSRSGAAPRLLLSALHSTATHLLLITAIAMRIMGRRLAPPLQCSVQLNSGAAVQQVHFFVFT